MASSPNRQRIEEAWLEWRELNMSSRFTGLLEFLKVKKLKVALKHWLRRASTIKPWLPQSRPTVGCASASYDWWCAI